MSLIRPPLKTAKKMYLSTCFGDCGLKHNLCVGVNKRTAQRRGLEIANEKYRPIGIKNRELVFINYRLRDIKVDEIECV